MIIRIRLCTEKVFPCLVRVNLNHFMDRNFWPLALPSFLPFAIVYTFEVVLSWGLQNIAENHANGIKIRFSPNFPATIKVYVHQT